MIRLIVCVVFALTLLGNAQSGRRATNPGPTPGASPTFGCPGSSKPDLSCDAIAAEAALRQANAAEEQAGILWPSLIIALVTAFVAGVAAMFARNAAKAATDTYRAFIAVEDASLVVEFPNGSMVESVVQGVPQPDTYFLRVMVTNMGRSTARIHGWTVGNGKFERREHTLKAGDTWKPTSEISFEAPHGTFVVTVHYSSPLHERMEMVVTAKVCARKVPNGGINYSGKVKSTCVRVSN